jgi:phosphohistidine swiveling domain-containing protein
MTKTLHFSITGDSITRHVRELVLEGNWRHAMKTLVDGFEGMTTELALAVLKGDKRLAGKDADLHDIDENLDTRAALEAQYAEALLTNTLLWGGKHYRAYALVTQLGEPDFYPAQARYDEFGRRGFLRRHFDQLSEQQAFDVERALHYANNREQDIALPVKDEDHAFTAWLLLAEDSAAADLPLWMQPNTRVTQLAREGRYLVPVRGYEEPKVLPPEQEGAPTASPAPREARTQAATASHVRPTEMTEAMLEVEYDKFVERVRERVTLFADNDAEYGWHEFKFHHEESGRYLTLKAPKRALMAFALSRTCAAHLAPAYTPFSQMGMKLGVDSPLHTDVWLGCGLNIDSTVYDSNAIEHAAFMEMTFEMQRTLLDYEFHVLTSGGMKEFHGRIVTPDARHIEDEDILLVPHAGVEFDLQARQAGAVICETGGKLAHLVTVCREDGKPIVRVPDAMKIFQQGMRVMLDLEKGKLEIWNF